MIFEPEIQISEEAIFSKDHKNPVFIVLSSGSSLFANAIKAVTKNEFSHAMISFNSKLDPLYSFGTRPDGKLGFVINNSKDKVWDVEDCKYSVYVMYVTDKAKRAMKQRLNDFVSKEKDLKYSFKGILDIWRGKESEKDEKWFCSRFVMEIISKAQKLTKVPSLWRPGDIEQLSNISLVNRGFNFYNYNPKVTERHCKDIEKGTYDPGDVIYEYSANPFVGYITSGNEDWLREEYKKRYAHHHYKVPEVGFPASEDEYLEVKKAAINAAKKYYKFKPSDANRDYPFKFYNILDIEKEKYIKMINDNVPGIQKLQANFYHCNFEDGKRRISVILIATPDHIYAMYLLLPNSVLLRFNYNGVMYQENTIMVDIDKVTESTIQELSSSVEKDFSSKKDMNLSTFAKIRLTDAIVQVYGQAYPSLRHIRINKDTKGYVWLNDKQVVGYINVEEKDDDYKWIQAFEIYEPYKGHGLSKQMLNVAIREFGATNLSVSKNNEVAIKLYKSYGFKTYKTTDSMYFMSRDKNIDEAYYVKDPMTGKDVKTVFTDNDYKITAQLAQDQIRKLHNQGKLNFVTTRDIEWDDGSLTYAGYEIGKDIDIVYLQNFINHMNSIVKTSIFCGIFELPENICKGQVGQLKLLIDKKWVEESKKEKIDEKGLKSYKNPARQLKVKNTIKRHDQISKGNYSDLTPSLPSQKDNK